MDVSVSGVTAAVPGAWSVSRCERGASEQFAPHVRHRAARQAPYMQGHRPLLQSGWLYRKAYTEGFWSALSLHESSRQGRIAHQCGRKAHEPHTTQTSTHAARRPP